MSFRTAAPIVLLWLAMSRRLRRAFQFIALAIAMTGCRAVPVDSNNLPIPPPADLLPKSAGIFEARGDTEKPGSTVWIVNARTDLAFGQETSDGQYAFQIFAECGDPIELTWTTDTQASAVRHQVIGERPEHGCDESDAGP